MLAGTLWFSCLTGPGVAGGSVDRPAADRLAAAGERLDSRGGGVAAAVTPLGFWLVGRFRAALAAALLSTAVQFIFLMTAVLPQVADGFSARGSGSPFQPAGRVSRSGADGQERVGSLVFYLDDRLRVGLDDRRVRSIAWTDIFNPRAGRTAGRRRPGREASRPGRKARHRPSRHTVRAGGRLSAL